MLLRLSSLMRVLDATKQEGQSGSLFLLYFAYRGELSPEYLIPFFLFFLSSRPSSHSTAVGPCLSGESSFLDYRAGWSGRGNVAMITKYIHTVGFPGHITLVTRI
jgi:hypothetical protein